MEYEYPLIFLRHLPLPEQGGIGAAEGLLFRLKATARHSGPTRAEWHESVEPVKDPWLA